MAGRVGATRSHLPSTTARFARLHNRENFLQPDSGRVQVRLRPPATFPGSSPSKSVNRFSLLNLLFEWLGWSWGLGSLPTCPAGFTVFHVYLG